MHDDDPARKYIPKPKNTNGSSSTSSGGTTTADDAHGIFTQIAYVTSWVVAGFGTLGGILILSEASNGYASDQQVIIGIVTIISSWVTASVLGTLAEISRKLTHRER